MNMKVLTWNIGGYLKKASHQLEFVHSINPDILTLQEVILSSYNIWRPKLIDNGYNVLSSFDLFPEFTFQGPRKYGVLIASKWNIKHVEYDYNLLPWPEKLVGLQLKTPMGKIEIFTTHIPPGASNGWIKIDTLNGVYNVLASRNLPRILTGDFNTPRYEYKDGTIITFGHRQNKNGVWVDNGKRNGKSRELWNAGELRILSGLQEFQMVDVYRYLNGYSKQDFSWYYRGKLGRRFDHIFASNILKPIECEYINGILQKRLSDHKPLYALFKSN